MSVRWHAASCALLSLGLRAEPARAGDRDLTQSKPQTAQIVTLARLAAVLCPETEIDEAAVHALMGQAGITDTDVVDPAGYGASDMTVARSFAQSFLADPNGACSQLFFALGPGEGQLLHRAGKPV